jgi:hypothetical protein
MTNEELQKIEQRVGFALPDYYKLTMAGYPFLEDEFTTPYLLPDNPKAVIRYNTKPPHVEGISKIFFIGGDPRFQLYFVNAALSDSPVYIFDLKTRKHSIKARTWNEYLELIRKEMKEVENEEAFERAQKKAGGGESKKKNIWKKDFSPSIWRWLSPVFGVLLLYNGIKVIITENLHYRLWVYHGITAQIGGVMQLLVSYLMFRGLFWKKRAWSPFDIGVGICAGAIFLGFLVLRWIDVLR